MEMHTVVYKLSPAHNTTSENMKVNMEINAQFIFFSTELLFAGGDREFFINFVSFPVKITTPYIHSVFFTLHPYTM